MRFVPPSRNPLPTDAPVFLTAGYDHAVAGVGSAAAAGLIAGVLAQAHERPGDYVAAAEGSVRAHDLAIGEL